MNTPLLTRVMARWRQRDPSYSLSDQQVALWCAQHAVSLLEIPSQTLLAHIPDPPLALFAQGNTRALWSVPLIAIVGTREASAPGRAAAYRFGHDLCRAGLGVVSGLARGVDAAAHHGALQGFLNSTHPLSTVAVLGHGLDRIYPAQNRSLASAILKCGGCLLSEYPPFVPPYRQHFPERNRLVAGLARGVVIVEAREKSGSLITAGLAVNAGRDVFVLPGPVSDLNYRGSHALIRTGACLVSDPNEILSEWNLPPSSARAASPWARYFMEAESGASVEKTFSQLLDATGLNAGALREALDTCVREGDLAEVAPQTFLWLSNPYQSEKPSCQINSF